MKKYIGIITIIALLGASAALAARTISGVSITTTTGSIGGWTIGSTSLSNNNVTMDSGGNITAGSGNNVVRLSSTDGTWRLWVGHATPGSAPFRVDTTGFVYIDDGFVSNNFGVSGVLTIGASGTFSMNTFGGLGNRTVCANNSGVFYTVASGVAC